MYEQQAQEQGSRKQATRPRFMVELAAVVAGVVVGLFVPTGFELWLFFAMLAAVIGLLVLAHRDAAVEQSRAPKTVALLLLIIGAGPSGLEQRNGWSSASLAGCIFALCGYVVGLLLRGA